MNYTVVINGFVWVGCMVYYYLFARRWYSGPRMTVDETSPGASDTNIYGTGPYQESTSVDAKQE